MESKYLFYPQKVLSGEIPACIYVKQACQRYLSFFDKYYFDTDAVDRVVNFCSHLKHFTGKSNGKPFVLSDFQFWIVCCIYGFKDKDGLRVCKNVYIELARKNGKSFFAAALALYGLIADKENGAEVELVANSAKQAGILFKMCSTLCEGIDRKKKFFKRYRDQIKFDKTKSFLQVLSTDLNNNDGWNSSVFVVDEYHSAPNSGMYDVLKSSQGMREQPLAIVITTAGFNLFGVCYQMRKTYTEILAGLKEDDTVFAAIYTLDEDDDWKDPKNFIKSNPNLNVTVKEQYLLEQINQAKNQQSMEVAIRTKNFNQWITSSDVWISNQQILNHTQTINLNDFKDCQCYMGVDLAAVSDLTALSLMIPYDGKFYFKNWFFAPESVMYNNINAEQYKKWKRTGDLIVTEGNVTDYDYILNVILNLDGIYINKIGYDSWNATQWAINATAKGLPLEPYSQALWNFNKPTKEFERLIKSDKIVIDNNEITRWCFSNVAIKTDHNDNSKPVKGGGKEGKIDGVIAMIEALGMYLSEPQYENTITVV